MNETYNKLNERLRPVYAQFLAERGIAYADIDPLMAEQFKYVEIQLASLIDQWLESLEEVA